ncbi:MAG: CPBP family intramembrane metalloprotease [Oscillospiraceae bacterium]|nr:CPBP family intramembrane metalloprotease [Oscillospiraceae bacterium]
MKKKDSVLLTGNEDIADISRFPAQTDRYNELYREWRCRKYNLFAFSGRLRQSTYTYVDGIGVQVLGGAKREETALKNLCLLITAVMVLYALVENVLVLPVMLLLKMANVEISYSFNEKIAYGNQYAVLGLTVFESLLKLLLPAVVMRLNLKMPQGIACPLKIRKGWFTAAAAFLLCACFSAVSISRLVFPAGAFTADNIGMSYQVIYYMNGWCAAAYIIFELAVVPALMEILFHGAMLQSMRQFGTVFAIVFTAMLNMAMMHSPESCAAIFVTSLISGWSVWKSGSLLTGIMIHIEARVLGFIMFKCYDLPEIMGIPAHAVCIFAMLLAGVCGFLIMQLAGKKQLLIKENATFLSMKTKAGIAAWKSPMLVVWMICLILFAIEIVM